MFAALIPVLGPILKELIGLIPDSNARAKATEALADLMLKAAQQSDTQQAAIGLAEAPTGKWGYRWAAGWLCVISLGYSWIVRDLFMWGMRIFGAAFENPPAVDTNVQYVMLTGMLGLATVKLIDLKNGTRK